MTRNHLEKALQQLRQLLDPARAEGPTDAQLLARFLATREEDAFATLVARHGPMVLGVCRRILRHTQDAEDAMQATFLVLARKASSVANHQSLGSWLYRVAYRIALEAKARNDKRRKREKQLAEMPHPQVLPAEPCDWRIWLDHELNLLPERYRAVLVVCDLQGRSRNEAARQLGVAEGTVSSRLARGRRLLAKRLSHYGLSLSVGTVAAALCQEASAVVPASLISTIVPTVSGQGVVSVSVGILTKGALKAMLLTKLKWTVGVVMVVATLGATGLIYRATGQSTPAPAAEKEDGGKTPSELEILRREVELIKLKLEVVQDKQRTHEAELRVLRQPTEADLKTKVQMLESELKMWKERAAWSERMSRPGRQYVTVSQAEADQARLLSARLALRNMETQLQLQKMETALKTLREARDSEAKRRAADELEKVFKKLCEQMDKLKDELARHPAK